MTIDRKKCESSLSLSPDMCSLGGGDQKRARLGGAGSPGAEALLNLDTSLTELFNFSPPAAPREVSRPDPGPTAGAGSPPRPGAAAGADPPASPVVCRRFAGGRRRRRSRAPASGSPAATLGRRSPSQPGESPSQSVSLPPSLPPSLPSSLSLSLRRQSVPAVERLRRRLAGEPPSQPGPEPFPAGDSQWSEAASLSGAPSPAEAESQRRRRALLEAALRPAPAAELPCSAVGPFHGLPSLVPALLDKQRGITSLYAWQEECLRLPAVLERRNLVYSLPTSGGKTLVAELLIMKEVLCRHRDCILVLPYVAIVQEKVRALAPFGIALGFLVEEYAGARGAFPPVKRRKRRVVYVCTIEKANGLVTSLLEQSRTSELGLVVVDEVHMLGEPGGRGATLELLITKLKAALSNVHLIGMSATIGNMADLAAFLDADVYTRPFRPVQLREHVLLSGQLLEVTGSAADSWEQLLTPRRQLAFQYSPEQLQRDPDGVGGLVAEVVPDNSCLVFCPTRKNCEAVARMICAVLDRKLREHLWDRKKSLYAALLKEGGDTVCPILRETMPFGVAYHHSGLTTDERKLLEEAYLEGTLCCLCCTSTLAAGVNLPARRVVLRSPYTGSAFLTRGRYKQMVGRAGRAGIDDSGESVLIVQAKDAKLVGELLMSPLERCVSTLTERDGHGLRRLLLSAVALDLADSPTALEKVVSQTLLAVQADALEVDCSALVSETVAALKSERLLRVSRRDGAPGQLTDGRWSPEFQLKVSRLGAAAIKGSVDLRVAGRLYEDLKHAQSSLAVINHLHLLYLVTPYDMMDAIRPDPQVYLDMFMSLEPEEAAVARLIGVSEAHVVRMMSFTNGRGPEAAVAHRFYLTLALHETLRSGSLWETARRCQLHRGLLQSLLQSAAAFSAAVLHFCRQLDELWPFVQLLDVFNRRLATGCAGELAQLMELPAVKQGRARSLLAAGYKTLQDVANADPEALVRTLEHLPRRVARQIVDSAKMLVLEKAEALQEEAEMMLDGLKSAQFHSAPGLGDVLLNSSLTAQETEPPAAAGPTRPP